MDRWIYFIEDEQRHAIKIGVATVVSERLANLQTAHAVPIRLLGVLKERRGFGEADLHLRFASRRMMGEWFTDHDDLRLFIRDHRELVLAEDLAVALKIEVHVAKSEHFILNRAPGLADIAFHQSDAEALIRRSIGYGKPLVLFQSEKRPAPAASNDQQTLRRAAE